MKDSAIRGKTTFRQALEQGVLDLSDEDPQWANVWAQGALKIQKSEFEHWLVESVMDPIKTELADIHAFLLIRRALLDGDVVYCRVHAGQTPYRNSQQEEMQAALNKLPSPFSATFEPRVGHDYGWDDGLSGGTPL